MRTTLLCFALIFAMTVPQLCAQSQRDNQPTFQLPGAPPSRPQDPMQEKVEADAAKQRNLQRQQDIKRDSEKLLELATELKQYVDKTNENIISLDVIKKADQIEKLAKSVKEKMKQ